ncbi:chemotaxis protein CheA [Modicisalibacter coralii]|uniref:chemotaxis protein CheA n=1 Tax=Modicisalibacter coralii TaxID=2304602 RepID=UPI00100B22BD|nr:chemotaxis protein CheA [Halomonas coralii]
MIDPAAVFRDEAHEHLQVLETALLELERRPGDAKQIVLAFRAMHTIKGAAGMVGFDHLSAFTHHLETLFDEVRNARLSLGPEAISLVLESRDHIETLLVDPEPDAGQLATSARLQARFLALMGEARAQPAAAEAAVDDEGRPTAYALRIVPSAEAFADGFDPLPVLRELSGLGECHAVTTLSDAFDPDAFDPERCHLTSRVLLVTAAPRESLDDVFIFVADDWRITIEALDGEALDAMTELLVAEGALSAAAREALRGALAVPAVESGVPAAGAPAHAGEGGPAPGAKSPAPSSEPTVKVPQGKLDSLLDQVAELVILQARLEQLGLEREDEALDELAEEMGRLTTGLRDTAFDIRMLPIGSTFGRFRRLVRDLSRELGKDVVLETDGADTELDKLMLDRLGDPLVHLLRNSLDHGIESPEARVAAGKPARGTLRLAAGHQQGRVIITLGDDGAGLDGARILAKAVEQGLVRADTPLDEHEIHQLIFEPGFSTAARVSDVSGRGVGMDVVKSSIESLQGRVTIDSRPGEGTTVRIELPMTLAIIDGLMVAVDERRYVVPLSVVEECIETTGEAAGQRGGVRLVEHRGSLMPCLRLREHFAVAGPAPAIEQSVVVRVGEAFLGLTVDAVIGHFQTVIKGLGRLYQGTPGVMGATIMGNGEIAMILDVAELFAETRPDRGR